LGRLHANLNDFSDPLVFRSVLWIIAEFSTNPAESLAAILAAIGDTPFIHVRE
jgi:hypothetical protein